MLDGMEKVASIEVDSSELQVEEDLRKLSLKHNFTSLQHRIGVQELIEPLPQLSKTSVSIMSEQVIDTNSIPTAENKDSPTSERDCTLHYIEESPEIQTSNGKTVADSQNDLQSLGLSHMPCTGTQSKVKVCEGYEDMTSDEMTEYTNRHNLKNQFSPHPSVSDKVDLECTMHFDQQKDLSEFKETHLKSILLKQVPCQTVDRNEAFVQNHLPSTPTKGDHKSAQLNALIPYKNLFLDYKIVPFKQYKIGSPDLESNLEINQNDNFLNKKASFIVAAENSLQIFEDVFGLKACDTSPKVLGNVHMNLENSIKNTVCGQGLTMHPSIHLHLNECPVVCFDNLANLVFKSSNEPLQIHPFHVLTIGKIIYLSGSSKNVAFSLDEMRLELSKPQYALSIPKRSQLHNTSIGTVICKIKSDRHCIQQSNMSSIHETVGGTLFSVPFNKPLSANITKNNEAISDCSFINVTPDCDIPQRGSAIRNHMYNRVALVGLESKTNSVSNCCGLHSEKADEILFTEARTLNKSGAENCTTFGTEYPLQNHNSPRVSMGNEPSVLPVSTIQHATRKRKGSTIMDWIEGKRQYNCKLAAKIHQNFQELCVCSRKPLLQKQISKSKSKETNLNHFSWFDIGVNMGYTGNHNIGTEYQTLMSTTPPKKTLQNIQSPQDNLSQQNRCSTVYNGPKQTETSQKLHAHLLKTACNADVSCAFSNHSYFDKSIYVEKQTKGNYKLADLVMTHLQSKHAAAKIKLFSTSVTQDKHSPPFCNHMKQILLASETKMAIKPSKLATRGVINPYKKTLVFNKCNKDQALLLQLSSIASRLMSQHKSYQELKSLSDMIDGSYIVNVQLQARKLLRAFSCVSMRLNSTSKESSKALIFKAARDSLISQQMNVNSAASHPGLFHSSDSRFSLDPSHSSTLPVSFHMKIDSKHLPEFLRFASPFSVSKRQASTTHLSQISLFLSSYTPASENVQLLTQWSPHFRALEPSNTGFHLEIPLLRTGTGSSMNGLYTVLALSSPVCYRLWTRGRNLGSRIPTIQRLSVAQFAQGLKGTRSLRSQGLFSCMSYSLGRVLSTWSQHGPSSNSSSYSTNHNTNCCSWQKIQDIKYNLKDHSDAAVLPKTSLHLKELCPSLAFSPPKGQVYPSEQQQPLQNQKQDLERKPQRVSQIRIRKTVPKPDPNLTPMGLPRPKRIKKKEFSLEDIYTNKNYKSPPPDRKLETIFEEPKERHGILECISQQKRKRVLEFRDCTVPRVKRPRVKIKVIVGNKRGRKAAIEGEQLDALLKKKLNELDHFIIEQEAMERKSEAAGIFCFGQ